MKDMFDRVFAPFRTVIISVRTDLGDLSSGGRFHERAAQYLQGVGPNVISRFNNGLSLF
jgi:hypothetical protein